MDNLRLWHQFLQTIKPIVGNAKLKTFFSLCSLKEIAEDKITIATPHAFASSTLRAQHLPLIEQIFADLLKKKVKIEFIVKEGPVAQDVQSEESFFRPLQTKTSALNPKYTMENFVVGPSNNVAYAAAQAVVANPGISYNPLFLYGGTGVGKTHLMLAVGNALLAKNPHFKIIYCASDKFMNDYVAAIQERKMSTFRAKYRAADILLVDDIQFFSGREGTQEEFFHTFNELQSKNSQMVLTSDKAPQEISKLEDRLKSRFAGGLMMDIQSPDFDTRVAILKAKCNEQGSNMPEDSLKLIAASLDSNIRELEGTLTRIMQNIKARNIMPSPENIALFLNHSHKKTNGLDHKKVLSTICDFFNIALKDLTGPKRYKELVLPRHIAMYLLAEELSFTVQKIGQILGGRDHTTVLHGRDRIKDLISKDSEIQRTVLEVKQKIYPQN